MLINLHVKNLALIEEAEVDFTDHLNILTGETGAGKSILIGSIQSALGGKIPKEMIREGADSALIELVFHTENRTVLEKLNEQAAANVLDDFRETKTILARAAESLPFCGNPRLKALGYRKIHFLSHRYFILYRVEGSLAVVDSIFHELQDFENKIR